MKNTANLSNYAQIFEPKLLAEMQLRGKTVQLKAGEAWLQIGAPILQMPLVLEGLLKVSRQDEDGRELLLYYVGTNEGCALTFTCCMQQHASEIQIVAEEDTTLFLLPIAAMDGWMMTYSTWKSFVMNTMRLRFNELLKSIDQIAFQKLDERLLAYLIEKQKATGTRVLQLSHEQIATDLATSRVVISRLLKKLEHDKKVQLQRTQIVMLA